MDAWKWYNASMGKKRLIVDLFDADHAALSEKARAAGLSVSNFVRRSCGLPLERQGIKRVEADTEKAAKSAEVRAKKAKKR
jgi:hypothetical protein